MHTHLILAYPEISKTDYEWMQSIGAEHDERYYNVVEPHFTIVFPIFDISSAKLAQHVNSIIPSVGSIEFNLKAATVVKDSFSDYTDVFLVPDKGNSDIIKLHDKLYSDIIRKELRLDIPFIPHIGIGASKNPEEAKVLADKLNASDINIDGVINYLDLVGYDYPELKTIERFELGYKS